MRLIDGIDNSDIAKEEIRLSREGKPKEAWEAKMKFFEEAKKLEDHCSCPEDCPHHGNCYECVIVHRGHRDHLPYCMWDMLNERIASLSLMTEHSVKESL
ncbi:MAG: LPS biosynthesis protein [Christensenellales bacterium]|jgi:hypothetical protein